MILIPEGGAYEKISLMIRFSRFSIAIPIIIISHSVCLFLMFAILDLSTSCCLNSSVIHCL